MSADGGLSPSGRGLGLGLGFGRSIRVIRRSTPPPIPESLAQNGVFITQNGNQVIQ